MNINEQEIANNFLDQPTDDSFTALFRVFTPQLIVFFRRRGHEMALAEDLAQDVMLTVYSKAGQVRDRTLFRAWLFRIARNTVCRHFVKRGREAPTVDMEDVGDRIAAVPNRPDNGASFEFRDWMGFLDQNERDVMTMRFVEELEYHEIAAVKAIPIGTVQWRVFNSKKKLAVHLTPRLDLARQAA